MKEALKLALELAIMHHSDDGYAELRSKVRQLAKEALAQPEQEPWCMKMNGCKTKCEDCPDEAAQPVQEPVAWRVKVETKLRDGSVAVGYQLRNEKMSAHDEPLYTTPPKPEPRNFCPRCGKRLVGMAFAAGGVHTCTPPRGLEMT